MGLDSDLYKISKTIGKMASIANDGKNIANGRPDKVVKKAAKREAYKGLSSILRKL